MSSRRFSPVRRLGPLPILLFWRRFSLRHAREEWLQTLLLLLILGLGVGTFLSIRIANRAAVEGFQLFTDSLRGPSDLVVESPAGIPVQDLPEIRNALGSIPADLFPVVEQTLHPLPEDPANPDTVSSPVRLLGLDLVQVRALTSGGMGDDPDEFWSAIDDPSHLFISAAVAGEWGVDVGGSIELILSGQRKDFTIRGILPEFRDGTPLPRNLAVADLSALVQRLRLERVDRVELLIPQGSQRDAFLNLAEDRLKAAFGERWQITTAASRSADGKSMTAAFRLNLTVLSLIALLVGMYLIAQTLDATVSRRRREIATLRSLGISSDDIYRLWLSEAVLYGIAAAAVGLLMGSIMAGLTVEAVTTTVRSLYKDPVQTATGLNLTDIGLAFALGLAGSLVAAWIPARDAASTPPAQFLRLGKRIPPFPIFQHPWIGVAAILAGLVLTWMPPLEIRPGSTIPVAGYTTAFLWLVGGTLVTAGSLKGIGHLLHRFSGGSATLRLAGSRLQQPTSRHQLALSGFFVAIGMAAAMAFLINSFEHTVTRWLEQRLRADLFVSSIGFQGSESGQRMPGELLNQVEATPGIETMDCFRSVDVNIRGLPANLGGTRFDLLGSKQELLWISGPLPASRRPPEANATGYANENLVNRSGAKLGSLIEVETPAGRKQVWIGGIHADYSSDNGLLLIDLPILENWYQIHEYNTASIFLEPGVDAAAIQAGLRERFPGLAIRQNGELKETALFIFNQTFAVTRALQLIGLVVAITGLVLSLLSLLRESGRELSLQKTLGMSRREIAATTAMEGLGIALTGLIAGLILSLALGLVLVHVINKQSFGWTLQVAYPWTDILMLAGNVIVLGFAISYATGWLYLRKWKQEVL